MAVRVSAERATVKVSNGALSSVRRESAPATVLALENTSNGPAKSRTSTSSKMKTPTVIRLSVFMRVLNKRSEEEKKYFRFQEIALVMRMKCAAFVSFGSTSGSVPASNNTGRRLNGG